MVLTAYVMSVLLHENQTTKENLATVQDRLATVEKDNAEVKDKMARLEAMILSKLQ